MWWKRGSQRWEGAACFPLWVFFSSVLFFTFCPHTLTRCWTTWVYHREGGRRVGCFLRAGNPNCRCSPKSPPTLLRTRHQGVRRALAGYQATLFKDTFKGTFQRCFSKVLFKGAFQIHILKTTLKTLFKDTFQR